MIPRLLVSLAYLVAVAAGVGLVLLPLPSAVVRAAWWRRDPWEDFGGIKEDD